MKIVRRIVSVLLCFVMLAALAAGVTMLLVRRAVSGISAAEAVDDGYAELLYDEVYAALEKKTALVVVKTDDISDIITEENVRTEAVAATEAVLDAMLGGDGAEWHYENEELYERVLSVLTDYAVAHGIEYEDGSAETVYTALCDTVTEELWAVSPDYAAGISPVICGLLRLCGMWYIPLGIYIICMLCVLPLGGKNVRGALYNVALASFVSVFAVACCTSILYGKDYLAETVLDNAVLLYFLRRIFNSVLYDVKTSAVILTAVFGAFGLAAAFASALGGVGRLVTPDAEKTTEGADADDSAQTE